jgi:tetratricopeptide (TPR) repeat protein
MIDFKKIASYIFSAFFFLLPIFYIPKIATSYILSQKLFASLFVFVIFSVWAADFWQSKKTSIKYSPFTYLLGGFLIFSTISFLASKSFLQSFLARGNVIDSFFMIIAYVALAFFGANLLSKKEHFFNVLKSFIAGSTILGIGFLLSLFNNFRTDFFTPVESFGIIFALGLSCVFALFFRDRENISRRRSMALGFASLAILSVALLIINYKLAWFFVFLSTFLIFWRAATEADFVFKRPKVFLPLIAAIIFLAFFFVPKIIPNKFNLNYEQSISYGSAATITRKTFSESPKNIFAGAGPATYAYEFSLYKTDDLAASPLVFTQGPIALLTLFGSLGVVAVSLLIAAYLFFMVKGFTFLQSESKNNKKTEREQISSLIFPIGFSLFALMFFYKMTILPMIFSFFVLGAWSFANSKREKEIQMGKHDYAVKFILAIIFLFLLIGNVFFVKQYIAESFYQMSAQSYVNQKNIDAAIRYGEQAINFYEASDYYIGLSQLYIIKASNIFNNNPKIDVSGADRESQTRNIASQAESLAKIATKKDPQNYNTWYNLGLIYENTSFLVDDKTADAIKAYDASKKLARSNVDIYLALARIYEKERNNQLAIDNYKKALSLNPGLTNLPDKINNLESSKK